MGTTLQNGVYLPNEGERNCYAGLKTNWEILDQKVADVTALQQAVAGALHREIVESLPTTDIDPNTIYMVLSGTSATENVYNEYMYVNNAWELIGTSATDLTNYYTKAEVDGKLLLKASASDLTSHTGDTTIHVTASDKTKWNNQTYVFRYSSTALVASSTNSNTLLDNTDNLKVGDKVIDSNGVLFSITAIDTVNSTFTIGSALIDLALDANVVHTSGVETIGGQKTFSHHQTGVGRDLYHFATNLYSKNTPPANPSFQYIWFGGNSASQGIANNWYGGYIEQVVNTDGSARGRWLVRRTDETAVASVEIFAPVNNALTFRPTEGNVMQLGDNTRPWKDCNTKAINGINPGALSFPDLSLGLDISGYITAGNSHNEYTPLVDGWISVILKSTTTEAIAVFVYQGGMGNGYYGNTSLPDDTGPCVMASIPVKAGTVVNIDLKGSNNYVHSAKFFPCQGNV